MGKSKSKSRSGSGRDILHTTSAHVKSAGKSKLQTKSTEDLLTEATLLLEQSQPELAFPLVDEALRRLEADRNHYANIDALLKQSATEHRTFPEALVLGAEVNLALGDVDKARQMFEMAVHIDPDGVLISAEPWLWLAQLCEEGGKKSIEYFERATEVLRNEAEILEEGVSALSGQEKDQSQHLVDEKKAKIAEALCGMTEVFMTDLSWEEDAEARCERYVTEAVAICPERLSAGTLQTLASVRISQQRIDEAKQALARSVILWKDLPEEVEDPARPDFPTRVSLARLLMEVEAESEAMAVIEGLVKQDDQSVESLYLGGWCQVILSQKAGVSQDDKQKHEEQARLWLRNCLKLYETQEYEDERLQEHALELFAGLNKILGIEDDNEEWEDEDDDGDDEDDELEVDINGHDDEKHDDVEMT